MILFHIAFDEEAKADTATESRIQTQRLYISRADSRWKIAAHVVSVGCVDCSKELT